jgi:high affinity sulfate transporter 1
VIDARPPAPAEPTHTRARILAASAWLRTYQTAWLKPDLVAGLTLAAYLLPAGLGNASLAGLPPEAGIYTCLFAGLVFWVFCSSRQTVITSTSALSLLIGASVGALSGGDPARHAALAAMAALLTAAIALVAWMARAASAAEFFSETVLIGFKAGIALQLASTQLPKLLGIPGTHGDFPELVAHLRRQAGSAHGLSLLVGGTALAILIAGRTFLKNRPVAFLVLVGGIAAGRVFDLDAHGVKLLGTVPQGLPALGVPDVSRADVNTLLPIALACFVLGAVETIAIGRMFGQRRGHRLENGQELLALGAANLAAGLGQGFPVSGGMSQSVVNESAGARTPLSGLVAAVVTLLVAVFATGLLRNLPQPVVAAVVLAAVTGLIDVRALRRVWRFSRREFLVAMTALAGVLGAGPANGVLLGATISIVLLLGQAARPRVVELGRVPGTAVFVDRSRNADCERTPGVLVVRCESSLLYFNASHVRDRVMEMVTERGGGLGLVVFFLGAVPRIDLSGTELLHDLQTTLDRRGIELRLANVYGEVGDALRRSGLGQAHSPIESDQTVDAAISAWAARPALRRGA